MGGKIVLANGVFWAHGRAPVEAVSVSDGRIQAVGTLADARAAVGPAEEIDLGGAAVLPGFVDSHLHVLKLGARPDGVPCWPGDVSSVAEIVARVRSAGGDLPSGACLRGRGFDPGQLEERRPPTARELDLGRDRLVVLDSMDSTVAS